jgi:molecular chaperone GrpE
MKDHRCCGKNHHCHNAQEKEDFQADQTPSVDEQCQKTSHSSANGERFSEPDHHEHEHTHGQCCGHNHDKENQDSLPNQFLHQMQEELSRLRNENLMLLAEMDNYRKRLLKEKQDISRNAIEKIIGEILTPLDQFEGALACATNMSDEVRNWAFGFNMILTQMKDILAQHNVTGFDALHTSYDPFIHEAIDTVETLEHPDGTVIKQYFKGYKMGDKVLRPAKVQVAKAPKSETNS